MLGGILLLVLLLRRILLLLSGMLLILGLLSVLRLFRVLLRCAVLIRRTHYRRLLILPIRVNSLLLSVSLRRIPGRRWILLTGSSRRLVILLLLRRGPLIPLRIELPA